MGLGYGLVFYSVVSGLVLYCFTGIILVRYMYYALVFYFFVENLFLYLDIPLHLSQQQNIQQQWSGQLEKFNFNKDRRRHFLRSKLTGGQRQIVEQI